jgi:hypothetical protein
MKCENLFNSVEKLVRVYDNEYTDQGYVGGECDVGDRNLFPAFKGNPRCYGKKKFTNRELVPGKDSKMPSIVIVRAKPNSSRRVCTICLRNNDAVGEESSVAIFPARMVVVVLIGVLSEKILTDSMKFFFSV